MPWYAPKRFFDLYDAGNSTLPHIAPHKGLPTNVPAVALQNWQVCGGRNPTHFNPILLHQTYESDSTAVPKHINLTNVLLLMQVEGWCKGDKDVACGPLSAT